RTDVAESSASIRTAITADHGTAVAVERLEAVSPTVKELPAHHRAGPTFRRMLLGACLSGVALMGTWGAVQQVAPFTNLLIESNARKEADPLPPAEISRLGQAGSANSLFWASLGAIVGTILAALLADRIGRRMSYFLLCLGSMAIVSGFYLTQTEVDTTYF